MRISDWSSDVCSSDLLQYYGQDNIAVDRHGNPLPQFGRYGETRAELIRAKAPLAPVAGYDIVPTRDVETSVLATAGARRWGRDAEEIGILFYVAEGRGGIVEDEKQVSALPNAPAPGRAPSLRGEWHLRRWE